MASPQPLIHLDGVTKSFALPAGPGAATGRRFTAVDGVSLQIADGAVFGLVGQSGAGKSTLLRTINLLERPDRGRVQVDGQELTALDKPALRAARQRIGMVFQQFNLLRNASVAENVAFPLRLPQAGRTAWRPAQRHHRVLECLDIVGLADKRDAHPAQLSGGQQQRVAIARALAPHPRVLLCDEPTSALDPETAQQVLDTLATINRTLGVTIVIVTHQLAVVRRVCTEVAVLQAGRIAEQFALDAPWTLRRTALGRAIARPGPWGDAVDGFDAPAGTDPSDAALRGAPAHKALHV